MFITEKEWNQFCKLREDLASALTRSEYLKGSRRYSLEGTLQLTVVFPDVYSDRTGTAGPSEWEIEIICHYDPDSPRAMWWGRTFEEAYRKCAEDVSRLTRSVDDEVPNRS